MRNNEINLTACHGRETPCPRSTQNYSYGGFTTWTVLKFKL